MQRSSFLIASMKETGGMDKTDSNNGSFEAEPPLPHKAGIHPKYVSCHRCNRWFSCGEWKFDYSWSLHREDFLYPCGPSEGKHHCDDSGKYIGHTCPNCTSTKCPKPDCECFGVRVLCHVCDTMKRKSEFHHTMCIHCHNSLQIGRRLIDILADRPDFRPQSFDELYKLLDVKNKPV
jgi:hypothetical protein